MHRVEEFTRVEKRLGDLLSPEAGAAPLLSPVLKTPEEVGHGSPLFLDMTEDARILFDRRSFFARELDRLRERLAHLGARRVWLGNAWYWDLKPDYRPGEVFELDGQRAIDEAQTTVEAAARIIPASEKL